MAVSKYTLEIKIPNAGNKSIYYEISLEGPQEDHPDDYFRVSGNRVALQHSVQEQSARQLEEGQLDKLIESWVREIKKGRFKTTVSLDLEIDSSSTTTISAFDKPLIQRPFSEPFRSTAPVATPKARKPQPNLSDLSSRPLSPLSDTSSRMPPPPPTSEKPPSAIGQLLSDNERQPNSSRLIDTQSNEKATEEDAQKSPEGSRISVEKGDDGIEF